MKLLIYTLVILLLFINKSNCSLLLVVGDVTQTKARILYELLNEENSDSLKVEIYKRLNEKLQLIDDSKTIKPIHKPQMFIAENLETNVTYTIQFGMNKSETVEFRTFADNEENMRFLIGSCDRSYEDNDRTTLQKLYDLENHNYDVMFHTGDQVYADRVWNLSLDLTYEEIAERFRDVYRITYGNPVQQSILRYGSHLALPDDHDIINNLDSWMNDNPKMKLWIEAAKLVTYEYQTQLYMDLDEKLLKNDKIYYSKRAGNTIFMMIDLRFYRTYHPKDYNLLVGVDQYRWVERELIKYDKDDSIQHIVIVSGIPLLWMNRFYAAIVYAVEKERYTGHKDLYPHTKQLLELIWKYRSKVDLLVGGDHHLYGESLVCFNRTCIPQIVASGFTKGSTTGSELKLSFLQFCITHFLNSFPDKNWYVRFGEIFLYKNYGVITINKDEIKWYGVKDDTGASFPFFIYQSFFDHSFELFMTMIFLTINIFFNCCCKKKHEKKD